MENNRGISEAGMLGILFIGLKLAGYIHWSWLWVLAPFWLPLAILLIGLACLFIVGVIFE